MKEFGLVEDKIYETDFFLERIKECRNPQDCKYYLSAFFSTSRSVTFTLQSSMKGIEGFKNWYAVQQEKLKQNDLAKKFVDMRNKSQKVGTSFIGSATSYKDEGGNLRMKFYFQTDDNFLDKGELAEERVLRQLFSGQLLNKTEDDIATQCEQNFLLLLEVIFECYEVFGDEIYPEKYYSLESLKKKGLPIEDIEENLGFDRGYTKVEGVPDEERIRLLREYAPTSEINEIFDKYLHRTYQ